MAHKIKFGNGVWANQEGSTLAYNDENENYKPLPFKVTRGSIGTRVNKQGLVEVVGHDTLRIDYTDSDKGVALLEPSSTNLFLYSQFFGTNGLTQYTLGTHTLNFTNNYSIAPDGSQTALRMEASIGSAGARTVLRDLISNNQSVCTLSVYIKSNTNENVTMAFHYDGGVRAPFIVTPEWQRFSYSETPNALCNAGIELNESIGTSNSCDVSVWGFQFEEISSATSVIPTEGVTVTRQADVVNGSGNSAVFNDSEGVLSINIAALTDDLTRRQISVSNGSATDVVRIHYNDDASNRIRFQVRSNNVIIVSQSFTVSNIKLYNKALLSYKLNDVKLFLNGFKVGTDGNTSAMPSGLNSLNFNQGNDVQRFFGKTKEINYYDTAMTDSELEYLTSYRSWESMVNELNLNIIYNG